MNSLTLNLIIVFLSIVLYSVVSQNDTTTSVSTIGMSGTIGSSTDIPSDAQPSVVIVTSDAPGTTVSPTDTTETDKSDESTPLILNSVPESGTASSESNDSVTPKVWTEKNETNTTTEFPPQYKYKILKHYAEPSITVPIVFIILGLIILILTLIFHVYMDTMEKQKQIMTDINRYKPQRKRRDTKIPKSSDSSKSEINTDSDDNIPKLEAQEVSQLVSQEASKEAEVNPQ